MTNIHLVFITRSLMFIIALNYGLKLHNEINYLNFIVHIILIFKNDYKKQFIMNFFN